VTVVGLFHGASWGLAVSECFGPGLWAGVGRDVNALVIEELDCLGVPERMDALPGVWSADHVDHAVDRDSAVGVGDAGGLAAAAGPVLSEGRDGFRVSWLGDRCGVHACRGVIRPGRPWCGRSVL
jgi:hypothetical protein